GRPPPPGPLVRSAPSPSAIPRVLPNGIIAVESLVQGDRDACSVGLQERRRYVPLMAAVRDDGDRLAVVPGEHPAHQLARGAGEADALPWPERHHLAVGADL